MILPGEKPPQGLGKGVFEGDKINVVELSGRIYEVGRYYRPNTLTDEMVRMVGTHWAVWQLTKIQRESVVGSVKRYSGWFLPVYQVTGDEIRGANPLYAAYMTTWEPLELIDLLNARARLDLFIRHVAREHRETVQKDP